MFWTLHGKISDLEVMPFASENIAVWPREERIDVTGFSKWGGSSTLAKCMFVVNEYLLRTERIMFRRQQFVCKAMRSCDS